MNVDFLAHASLWVAQSCYLACLIPQIITNYSQRSGKGVSSLLLVGYLNAYLFLLFYVFFMNLPLAYKTMVPLQTLATIVLVMQYIHYDGSTASKKYWCALGINLILFLFFVPYAHINPILIGMSFGWINLIISIIYQLPQIFKIHREKSVIGFNFLFVLFTGMGALIEILMSWIIHLPPQTQVSALRAITLCLIFSWQFYRYR